MSAGPKAVLGGGDGFASAVVTAGPLASRLRNRTMRRIIRNPRTILGLVLLAIPLLLAVVGPTIAQHGATTQNLGDRKSVV